MLVYQDFDQVFSFNPECQYEKSQIHSIDTHRKKLEGLFIDRVLKLLGIKRPSKIYPPKSNGDLRSLHKAVLESNGADHHKISVLYYILLDFDFLTARRDYSTSFEEKAFLPQKYQIYMQGLWFLDHLDFELALQYLTHPSLIPTFSDEIMQVLVEHSGNGDLALPLAYYHTVRPVLTNPHSIENLFLAIVKRSVTEAFYFSRAQPEHIQRRMFETLVALVLNSSSASTIADQAAELVGLPFTQEEESWFEDYLLHNEGIRKVKDAIMMHNCKFEHPGDRNVPNSNRFTPLQNSDTSSNSRKPYGSYQNGNYNGTRGGLPFARTLPYGLDKDVIITDLTVERPQWILSAYGPGRQAPAQLFGGPVREQSFEEMRLLYYIGVTSGNPEQAIQDANQLRRASEQQIENILHNIDGAISYIIEAENEHPNRIDICKGSPLASLRSNTLAHPERYENSQTGNPFANRAQLPSTSTFGNPSAISSGTFGKPSVADPAVDSFGSISASKTTPQLGVPGTFGQPMVLGQKLNPFGSQATTFSSESLSKTTPAQFPMLAVPSNSFAQQPQPTASSSPSGPRSEAPLLSQPGSSNNDYQKSPYGSNFGSNVLSTQPNPFGPASRMSAGQQGFPGSESMKTKVGINPFTNASTNPITRLSSIDQGHLLGNGNSGQAYPGSNVLSQHHGMEPSISRDSSGRLSIFKGKPVQYRDGIAGILHRDDRWEKIWFSDGPPPYNKDTELDDDAYDENTKAAYLHVLKKGTFRGGVMPLLPPKAEWCSWDF
ncbi:hypothetical protein B7463_g12552, partial [Scytalidium lignicola]